MIEASSTPLQDERFLVLEALGRGGTSAVYRAFDRAEQRLVALKVSSVPCAGGPAHPLAAEFDCWAQLGHPNVVRAYEMGHAARGPLPEGTPYLVLEHVRGHPVHIALGADGTDAAAAESVAVQVLAALDHVHAAGFVHRDIKPSNVLAAVTGDGQARFKLTDFGLATRIGCGSAPGTVSGSLPYVSPEALLGLPLDGRSDLYGLGLLLFRLVTGRLPCPGGGPCEVLDWHLNGPAVDPASLRPELPPRLCRFIRRLTRRDPDRRPPSAALALELLGARPRPSAYASRAPIALQGAVATLRLALDAARLGARRVFRLPAAPATADLLLRELTVWTQVRNVRYHRAGDRVERLVLRLLAERGAEGGAWLRRFDLDRWLPLDTLGGIPIADRTRCCGPARAGARAIADFILDCARERPLVLSFDETAAGGLGRAAQEAIVRAIDRAPHGGAADGAGGLLVVVR